MRFWFVVAKILNWIGNDRHLYAQSYGLFHAPLQVMDRLLDRSHLVGEERAPDYELCDVGYEVMQAQSPGLLEAV